jgi:transcriptional regulator with XRE-family HTH domain
MEPINTNHFAANLRALRVQHDMSQQDVSDKLGVKRTTYSGWENKLSEPSLMHLQQIEELYQIGMDVLLRATLFAYTTDQLHQARMAFAPRPRVTRNAA